MNKTITTSRKLLFTLWLAASTALLAASCSGEESTPTSPRQEKESSTIVDLGNVKFDMSELPFGTDTEGGTRSAEKAIVTDTIGLCEGIEAEISLEPEQLPSTRAVKQGLSDGAYRLIVYKNNIFQKQIGFTVSGGKVTHLERLALPTGTYNFYCYNDKVQFDEPQNKFRAEFDNGATALNLDLNASMSNDYTYFVSHTPLNEIVIRFTNGSQLYHKAMNTFAVKKLSQGSEKIDVNKSYTLNIKLVPNFKYVFQDGARGYLRDRGNRLPVALVVNDHLGIALQDAHPVGYPNDLCPSPSIPIDHTLLSWTQTWGVWGVNEKGNILSIPKNNAPENAFLSWQEALAMDVAASSGLGMPTARQIKGLQVNSLPFT